MTNNNDMPEKVRRSWLLTPASQTEKAIAAGTAAVPFARRMIDVPVDEWAKVVMAMSTACQQRDAEKKSAFEAASA